MPRSTQRREISIPIEMHARLHRHARSAGVPATYLAIAALEPYLTELEAREAQPKGLVPFAASTSTNGVGHG